MSETTNVLLGGDMAWCEDIIGELPVCYEECNQCQKIVIDCKCIKEDLGE